MEDLTLTGQEGTATNLGQDWYLLLGNGWVCNWASRNFSCGTNTPQLNIQSSKTVVFQVWSQVTALPSPGNLWEMQILSLTSDLCNPNSRWGPRHSQFNNPLGDSESTHIRQRTIVANTGSFFLWASHAKSMSQVLLGNILNVQKGPKVIWDKGHWLQLMRGGTRE